MKGNDSSGVKDALSGSSGGNQSSDNANTNKANNVDTKMKNNVKEIINVHFAKILRSISGKTSASLIKVDRNLSFRSYIDAEEKKSDVLKQIAESGCMDEKELFVREKIIFDRINILNKLDSNSKIVKPFYYLAVFDSDKTVISEILNNAVNTFLRSGNDVENNQRKKRSGCFS